MSMHQLPDYSLCLTQHCLRWGTTQHFPTITFSLYLDKKCKNLFIKLCKFSDFYHEGVQNYRKQIYRKDHKLFSISLLLPFFYSHDDRWCSASPTFRDPMSLICIKTMCWCCTAYSPCLVRENLPKSLLWICPW